ncbi:hypothetical protein PRUPE_5G202200 [Prunus persica]|uniref:Uncharacterized protein n=1 Tax=Prunus persica TaxID=3760 RepID=A0A251PB55_PRUPE|nr:hypothetical protein PRUPE_5G202200 [Prunus persica]
MFKSKRPQIKTCGIASSSYPCSLNLVRTTTSSYLVFQWQPDAKSVNTNTFLIICSACKFSFTATSRIISQASGKLTATLTANLKFWHVCIINLRLDLRSLPCSSSSS